MSQSEFIKLYDWLTNNCGRRGYIWDIIFYTDYMLSSYKNIIVLFKDPKHDMLFRLSWAEIL